MALSNGPVAATSAAEVALFDLVDVYDRAYEEAAARLSLSAAQACVLGRLGTPRGMGALARELGCDASNVTQIVARLETAGLLTRRPNPDDGRSRLVARTARGDEVNRRFEEAFAFARAAVGRLTPDEQDQLTALVRKALG
ncbi:MarR family winged helix-turn-helix transcriptional regulator [Cellulosimicrobium funkei]|jgi:DNA-binding MarR family transcriptional regulator|uniref:MarR family winged helix-turn-helix transcriptional regulator n=1 Tax=Cellulosimicrobium funkei TaxID=264251 RepID=UPI00088D72D9|nr:MarR family transcriptional regulator [Sphaerisporangium cinnabarinum]PTU57076.1 MarR family transcriptional regulator [Sphaerisporangium cinnabarinum]SDF30558.1 DNA-binding transcriptional regulator, MarR family [Cellulosimicrobium cellulans]